MGILKNKDQELLAAEVFLKTGIPISPEDPIFAFVELLKSNQADQEATFDVLCHRATDCLKAASEDLAMRSEAIRNLVDTYIEHRLEATNVTLDLYAHSAMKTYEEAIRQSHDELTNMLRIEFNRLLDEGYNKPELKTDVVFPTRSWIDSLWTLTACIAIGFLVGFIYFNGTIREPLLSQLELLERQLPSSTMTSKH